MVNTWNSERVISFKDLNDDSVKKLQKSRFVITDFTDGEIEDITEGGRWIYKQICDCFPNSVIDFVSGEGMYVTPN